MPGTVSLRKKSKERRSWTSPVVDGLRTREAIGFTMIVPFIGEVDVDSLL